MGTLKEGDRVTVTAPEEISKNFYREGATGTIIVYEDDENIHVLFDSGDFTTNQANDHSPANTWWVGGNEISLA